MGGNAAAAYMIKTLWALSGGALVSWIQNLLAKPTDDSNIFELVILIAKLEVENPSDENL